MFGNNKITTLLFPCKVDQGKDNEITNVSFKTLKKTIFIVVDGRCTTESSEKFHFALPECPSGHADWKNPMSCPKSNFL